MAKIQTTITEPVISLQVRTMYSDEVYTERTFTKGKSVKFRYIEDCTIKEVEGVIKDIIFKNVTPKNTKSRYKNVNTIQSYFAIDNINPVIQLDISALYHSNIIEIKASDIIEDVGERNVAKMDIVPSYAFNLTIELSDGTSQTIQIPEGKKLDDITYVTESGDKVYDALVVAITYDSNYNPLFLETICNGGVKEFDIKKIKHIEGVLMPPEEMISDYEGDITVDEINDVLNS